MRSYQEVIDRESYAPNSTIDSKRFVRSAMSLLATNEMEPRGSRFLDVGCGFGFSSAEAARAGFEVEAIELAPFERACATKMLGMEPTAVAFEDFPEGSAKFSVVLMSQVLEHVVDVNEWIAKARRLLIRGGVVVIAVPNFGSFLRYLLQARDPYINPPEHLNYFSSRSLTMLLERHGLNVVETQTVSRIPESAVTKRLRLRHEVLRDAVEHLTRTMQRPPLAILDWAKLGMFLNLYAIRR